MPASAIIKVRQRIVPDSPEDPRYALPLPRGC